LPTTACARKIRQDLFSTGHQPDAQAERDPQSKLQKGISMAQTIEIKSRGVNAMNAIGWVTFDFWRQEEAEKLEADLQAEYPGKYRLEKHIRPKY
jgi:hypothetical protein